MIISVISGGFEFVAQITFQNLMDPPTWICVLRHSCQWWRWTGLFPPELLSSVITTKAQTFLERFNLFSFHCSNKQSGWCQMQKTLLNNSEQSLRLISMNKYNNLRGHVDHRCFRFCNNCNKDIWWCAGLKREEVDVHALLCQILNGEVETKNNLFRRAFHSKTGGGVDSSLEPPGFLYY